MEKHRRAHRWAFPLGVVLTALAVVGLATLVRLAAGGIRQQLDNTKEKAMYEEFLATIILHDPDTFDSVGSVPDGRIPQLLDISIWAILNRIESAGALPPTDDAMNMLIKEADVEAEFVKIFGQKPPTHASIEGSDFGFIYDPAEKVYRIPTTGSLSIYFPRVTNIKKTGGAIELTVNYLAYNDFKLDDGGFSPEDPEPAKTMLITLYEQADPDYPFRVGSISEPPGGEE
ncbi:MAG: hypothetical protein FWC27_10935 [Firmicutes bacterium]|nr:hypothetical protein [Bacillota bacterium]